MKVTCQHCGVEFTAINAQPEKWPLRLCCQCGAKFTPYQKTRFCSALCREEFYVKYASEYKCKNAKKLYEQKNRKRVEATFPGIDYEAWKVARQLIRKQRQIESQLKQRKERL